MKATYVSIWDGGVKISTSCDFNPETKEVSDIETTDIDGLDILEEQILNYQMVNRLKHLMLKMGLTLLMGKLRIKKGLHNLNIVVETGQNRVNSPVFYLYVLKKI